MAMKIRQVKVKVNAPDHEKKVYFMPSSKDPGKSLSIGQAGIYSIVLNPILALSLQPPDLQALAEPSFRCIGANSKKHL